MSYIVIPIFSDPFLHPLHKDNGLSLLYIKELDGKSQMICQFHPDCVGVLEDFTWLEDELIFTPDAKVLQHIHPFKNVIDMNWEWWSQTNKPFDMSKVRNNAYDFFYNKYYNAKRLNEIIPILKHKEWCVELEREMGKMIDINESLGWEDYGKEVTEAFSYIESNGVKVSDDVCDIFDMRVKKHISNGKLYSNYNLWTTTGRPSNSFGTVNFAALPPEKRKAFIPENDSFVEYDFDAYHLRLIANLINYDFGGESVHEHFAKIYDCEYDEAKQKTFQILYGGIRDEHRHLSQFFNKTYVYINKKWNEINTHNCVFTDIYRRKLLFENYTDMNRNKLFNYLIQAYETEMNIKKILDIQEYLNGETYDCKKKKTKLVLYGYDSFLFDFSNEDGVDTLKQIKMILEDKWTLPTNRVDYKPYFLTKIKMGDTYGSIKDITKRL